MKKFLALLLALVMVFALAACGGGDDPATTDPAGTTDPGTTETDPATSDNGNEAIDPNDIPDTMESDTYEVAFITDVGDLKDKSFNEGTWNGVKTYAYENNLSYKYYQPANGGEATDTDRYDAMKQAVDNGASVVVCVGFLQENAIRQAAAEFTDVHFIFIDGSAVKVDPDNKADDAEVFANTVGVLFREEQCGYLAGYAVVKEGYTQLGFAGGGGGTNPACCRYGYGYLQGA
ncbi:MAG: BMP family lipoprotein, partial [Oscillospiraceae bacterium]